MKLVDYLRFLFYSIDKTPLLKSEKTITNDARNLDFFFASVVAHAYNEDTT